MWFIDKCKCCLKDGDMKDMWSEYVNDGQVEIYGDMLASCFALPGNDRTEYMEKICESCVERLRAANEFRQEVLTSKEVLDKLIEQSREIKLEMVEADEDSKDPDYEQLESLESFEFEEHLEPGQDDSQDEDEDMQVEYLEDDIEAKRYKIIKIIEKGKFSWIAVPAFWEKNFKVKIPLTNRTELIKSYAKPKSDWKLSNCKVIKKVKSLKEAEKEIGMILARNVAKRYARDPLTLDKRLSRSNNTERSKSQENSKHDLASVKSIKTIDLEIETSKDNEPSNKDTNEGVTASNNTTTPNFRTGDDKLKNSKEPSNKEIDLNAKIDKITSQISAVIENQKVLSANQETMSLNMLKQNIMLEQFIKSFHSQEIYPQPLSNDFEPISTEEELHDFEQKLKDTEYKMELMKKFNVLFSKGPGKGANNAYRLIDILFRRDFMPSCSWSGGSRGEEVKICFKAFQNILKFFFSCINSTDELYTMDDCENFFKIILRNSKKRIHCGIRQSKTKCRKSKKFKKPDFVDGGDVDD